MSISVNPIRLESIQWKFYFVYIAILTTKCFFIRFYFIETKGPTLDVIARLFDGEDMNFAGKGVVETKTIDD